MAAGTTQAVMGGIILADTVPVTVADITSIIEHITRTADTKDISSLHSPALSYSNSPTPSTMPQYQVSRRISYDKRCVKHAPFIITIQLTRSLTSSFCGDHTEEPYRPSRLC